jgi:hypothetical protein
MPVFEVVILERNYSAITKYVYADSKEQLQAVDSNDWGDIPDYYIDIETLESNIDEINLIDDTELIKVLEQRNQVHKLPHQHGDRAIASYVRSDSCGAWICSCGAHFSYQGKDKEPGPMLARCYCGWAADGGNGVAQLRAAGENVEDDY